LSFKSGPNRGHYHGDQLAFHYCAKARPVAVDHHCSYSPRASQEHMHNRVAFSTDDMPSANMDGLERLIAFKTSTEADVAIGQVESWRLRHLDPLPPPKWHPEFPQHPFQAPLVYRRAVVLMKSAETDYFVIRDQFSAPEPLHAAYCLHVPDPEVILGPPAGALASGNVLTDPAQDFVRLGVQPGWMLAILDRHKARNSDQLVDGWVHFASPVASVTSTSLTTQSPLPERIAAQTPGQAAQSGPPRPFTYRLFKPVQQPAPGAFRFTNQLRLYCFATGALEVSYFPWEHNNGGRESTQGLRLTLRGARVGQFVSVLCHGQDLAVSLVEGGVRVGQDEVLFSGEAAAHGDDTRHVVIRRGGREILVLTGREIDLDRSQGDVGLCVCDSGHPFGGSPDWLIRQRARPPKWAADAPGAPEGRK
jgi:hypothetical protein